ncbi:MAG: hypothetical protein COA32_16930 [Fluviicola sp.]|nr:MAG: hypothetical protein COA32_16930 [Fluviicola sp.]
MNPNLSNTDRVVRFLLFVVAIVLFVTDVINGWLAYSTIFVGTVFLLTSLMSFCPIYRALGICSKKTTETK